MGGFRRDHILRHFLAQTLVGVIERLIRKQGDGESVHLENAHAVLRGVDDARRVQRGDRIVVARLAKVHHMVVFQRDGFHGAFRQHLYMFRRRAEEEVVPLLAARHLRAVRQHALKVDERQVVLREDVAHVREKIRQIAVVRRERLGVDVRSRVAFHVAAQRDISRRGDQDFAALPHGRPRRRKVVYDVRVSVLKLDRARRRAEKHQAYPDGQNLLHQQANAPSL